MLVVLERNLSEICNPSIVLHRKYMFNIFYNLNKIITEQSNTFEREVYWASPIERTREKTHNSQLKKKKKLKKCVFSSR